MDQSFRQEPQYKDVLAIIDEKPFLLILLLTNKSFDPNFNIISARIYVIESSTNCSWDFSTEMQSAILTLCSLSKKRQIIHNHIIRS